MTTEQRQHLRVLRLTQQYHRVARQAERLRRRLVVLVDGRQRETQRPGGEPCE